MRRLLFHISILIAVTGMAGACLRTLPETGVNFSALLLLSSGSSGSGSSAATATITANPPNFSGLTTTQSIVVSFSRSMDPSSASLSSTLSSEVGSSAWSSTSNANDTLTISPATAWTTGNDRTLNLSLSDTDNAAYSQTLSYDVVNLIAYVSLAGNNANAGDSASAPKRNIQDGITLASTNTPAIVQIAGDAGGGTYTPGASITLVDGVSIKGGFSPDFTARSPQTYPSTVENTSASGTASIFSGSGLSNTDNQIEGMAFELSSASGSSTLRAISLDNSTMTLFGNVIRVGVTGSASTAIALYVNNPNGKSVIAANNILTFGDSATLNDTAGIVLGGNGTGAGIFIAANNILVGGSAGTAARGVWILTATTPDPIALLNNTMLVVGPSGTQHGIQLNATAAGDRRFRNNIILADDDCIREESAAFDDPTAGFVDHNNLACGTAYRDEGGTAYGISGTIDTAGTFETLNATLSNVAVNPQFSNAGTLDLTLTTSTPCSVATGGIDTSGIYGITFDLAGTTRTSSGGALTTGWSMGAYEYDGSCL